MRWVPVLLALAACGGRGVLLVRVTTDEGVVPDVDHLHVVVDAGGAMSDPIDVKVPGGPTAIPPDVEFALGFGDHQGNVTVTVDAYTPEGTKIASASGGATVGAGASSSVTVKLPGAERADMMPDAQPVDAGGDGAFVDGGTGDLPPPDLAQHPTLSLAAPTEQALAPQAVGTVATDLDGDGRVDLVLVDNPSPPRLVVALGTGSGTFRAPTYVPLTEVPLQPVAADVTGDGKPDLVAALPAAVAIGVFVGDGMGGLGVAKLVTTAHAPAAVAAADLDGDGKADLVAVESLAPGAVAAVRLGTGGGSFGTETHVGLPSTMAAPVAVALADLDGDKKLDLVTLGRDSAGKGVVAVATGNGDGTFGTAVPYALGTKVYALGLADVSGDGRPDVVVGGDFAFLVLVTGAGGVLGTPASFAIDRPSAATALADYDGDGLVDVAANGVVCHNGGGAKLGPCTDYRGADIPAANANPTTVAADVDGDGHPDLVELGAIVLRNDGKGGFVAPLPLTLALPQYGDVVVVTAGDFNGDQRLDLVLDETQNGAPPIGVFLGDGKGGFAAAGSVTATPGTTAPLAVGDLDGNGTLDVATLAAVSTGGTVPWVLLGDGKGGLAAATQALAGGHATVLRLADLDGNGRPDLVTNEGDVYLNQGNGTFAAPAVRGAWFPDVALADLDGDGAIDLAGPVAATGSQPSSVSGLLNDGKGHLATAVVFSAVSLVAPQAIASADLDHDGKADLVVADQGAHAVVVLLATGGGGFQAAASYPAPVPDGATLAVADFDRDGILDVAVLGGDGATTILAGTGGGKLADARTWLAEGGGTTVGDFDGDGRPDVIAGPTLLWNTTR